MALFDFYIMVDWSARNGRVANLENCIWMAHGALDDDQPTCESPLSRTEAIERVTQLACDNLANHRRVLAGFDFAFGYPRGFAEHLPVKHQELQPWHRVWEYLATNLQDDLGTRPAQKPTNRSNRFDVANQLNSTIANASQMGPYWCAEPNWRNHTERSGEQVWIPKTMPVHFMSQLDVPIPGRRTTDERLRSDYLFRLFGHGSVGSQMLTGIPRLHQLRNSPGIEALGSCRVWPFETGWAPDRGDQWLSDNERLLFAEIYPSVRPPMADNILDRGQVRAMWHWAKVRDQDGQLQSHFGRPTDLNPEAEAIVLTEEGWILH